MPTIIRKTQARLFETRRETSGTVIRRVQPAAWRPLTDVYETANGVVVKIEVAGIRDEDLEVIVHGSVLQINGKRNDFIERRAYHQMEIPFGSFSVVIELPAGAITDTAEAEYKDGFLIINFDKEKTE